MSDIRLATVGTSAITSVLAFAVTQVDGIRIHAVFSRDSLRAAAKAQEFDADWSTDDYEDVLSSSDVDAVYIASPNSLHAGQISRAIDAGKHVLVEKPAVVSPDEWTELVARASRAGVVLLEGLRSEYDPGMAAVRALLPEVGPIRYATLRYQKRSARYDQVLAGEQVNIFDSALAGGALLDLGVYCIHAMVTLFGVPQAVHAAAVAVASGVDGAGAVIARYPGLVVDLGYSKITTSTLPSEIQGEAGTLTIDHIASPRSLRLLRADGTQAVRTLDEPQHSLIGEVGRFVELVSGGGDPRRDHRLTEQTLRVVADVQRSIRTTSPDECV